MKRYANRISLALTVLAVLGLTVAAVAQQSSANLVSFKFTYLSTGNSITIPVNPPIEAHRILITGGQADFLGPVSGIAHVINHLGPDGRPAYHDGGVLVLTAPNGDSVFFTYAGSARPSTTPGVVVLENHMTITGGKGRFADATGSGILTVTLDLSKGESVGTFVGMITAPKQ